MNPVYLRAIRDSGVWNPKTKRVVAVVNVFLSTHTIYNVNLQFIKKFLGPHYIIYYGYCTVTGLSVPCGELMVTTEQIEEMNRNIVDFGDE